MTAEPAPPPQSLAAVFFRFLRFGLLAWGGPIAQIAMVRRELVDDRRWLSGARFNRLLAVYQVLPGPEAHEMCVHLGMVAKGRAGGIAAGLGFMLPGLLLMLALSWGYARLDLTSQPWAALFLGVQVGVVALIVRAVHRIGEHVLLDARLWLVAALAFLAALIGMSFWLTLPATAIGYALLGRNRVALALLVLAVAAILGWLTLSSPDAGPALAEVPPTGGVAAASLFLSGLKAGLLTFGGAYTAIPFIREDMVGRGWISDGQFLDGLALAGIIPAPLIIFATFVGYQAGGLAGALAMTAGVFLPAFGFSLIFFERLERVMDNARLHDLLAGVAAAVVGLVAATTVHIAWSLAAKVPSPWPPLLIFVVALAALYRWRSALAVPAVMLMSATAGTLMFASA